MARSAFFFLPAAMLGVLLAGCSQSGPRAKSVGRSKAPSYDSPKAVLDTAIAAWANGDYQTFTNCLTPESHDFMAGIFVLSLASMAMLDQMPATAWGIGTLLGDTEAADERRALEKWKAAKPKLLEVLKKNGWTEDKLPGPNRAPQINSASDFSTLAEPIREKAAFVVEVYETLDSYGLVAPEDGMFSPDSELVDLRISETTATGALSNKELGDAFGAPIRFRKVDDRWLIHVGTGY